MAILVASTLGCGGKAPAAKLPTVYKVSGKVIDAAGQPVTGGTLQWASQAEQGQTGIAEIKPDGTFSVVTIVDGHKLEGAVAGGQTVTYMPLQTADQAAAVPQTLKQIWEVKPQDNDFTIQIGPGK